MSQSPNLDIPLIDPNQTGKALALNEAIMAIERAATESYSADLTGITSHVLPFVAGAAGTKVGLHAVRYRFFGNPGAAYEVIHPAKRHWFFAQNDTAHPLTVKTAAGSGATIIAGVGALCYCDGVNVVEISVSGTPGPLNTITDVDTATNPPVEGRALVWRTDKWVPDVPGGTKEIIFYAPGTYDPNLILGRYVSAKTAVLLQNLPNAQAYAGEPAQGNVVLSIVRRTSGGVETTLGTITFAAGQAYGTFQFSQNRTLNLGDVLEIVAPLSPDLELADVAITLIGVF